MCLRAYRRVQGRGSVRLQRARLRTRKKECARLVGPAHQRAGVMSQNSPYPSAIRPYYKGHSREEDEKLARELFFGTSTIIDGKTDRWCHEYLPADSPEERRAFEALERLLEFSCGDLNPDVLGGLIASLERDGSFGRRLVFKKERKRSV